MRFSYHNTKKNIFDNSIFVLWILFLCFFQLLLNLSLSYFFSSFILFNASVALLYIFIISLWFIVEPAIVWGMALISVIYFSIFPGFLLTLSPFLFLVSFVLNQLYNKRQNELDLLDKKKNKNNYSSKSLDSEINVLRSSINGLQENINRVCLFKKMIESLSTDMDTNHLLKTTTGFIEEIIGEPELIRLYLTDNDTNNLILRYEKNYSGNTISQDASNQLNEWVLKNNKSLLVHNINLDKRFDLIRTDSPMFLSCVIAPLFSGGRILGIIRLDSSQPDAYNISSQRMLSYIANVSALIISNINLYEITKKLAVTDGLTGLYTRAYFMESLKKSVSGNNKFSLAIIDLDYFKQVNDKYGHIIGDQVLIRFSGIVKASMPQGCICARFGGEEFAIIFPETPLDKAYALLQGLRLAVENEVIVIRGEKILFSMSAGIGNYPDCAETADELISAVDSTLYTAKINGRNRVEVAK